MGSVELHMENIEAMFADPAGPVGQIIEKKTLEVKEVAKSLLLIPGSGSLYLPGVLSFKRGSKWYSNWATGGRTTAHTASSAFAPPSSDTGKLFASIWHDLDVDVTVRGRVGSSVPYILYLELGTKYMEPRPFLVPALHIVVP